MYFGDDKKVVNKVNLDYIMRKSTSYKSLDEFRMDIALFVHNLKIAAPKNSKIQTAADKLVEYVDEDIFSLKTCLECFENAVKSPDTSFTIICNRPHILVWARMENFIFWPAKAMSAANGKVHIRYFGDHTTGEVKSSLCYLYSEESPDGSHYATNSECEKELVEKTKQVSSLHFKIG